MAARSPQLNIMINVAEKAGRALIRDFKEVENLQVSRKSPGDFVSAADQKSEKIIREELTKARPKYSFLLEEGGEVKGEDPDYRWIVDPLDGTSNFLHGLPLWCIAIALEKAGEIVAAVVYDPIINETFYGEKGGGVLSTYGRARVSGKQSLDETLIDCGRVFGDELYENNKGCKIRHLGSASLGMAYVAAGRLDAYAVHNLAPWDKAAGMFLVKEAGGSVSNLDGSKASLEGKGIVASNPNIHQELLKLVKKQK